MAAHNLYLNLTKAKNELREILQGYLMEYFQRYKSCFSASDSSFTHTLTSKYWKNANTIKHNISLSYTI